MSEWKPMSLAMPRDGTLLRIFCHGRPPDFPPFVCLGRFIGTGWASYEGDKFTGMVKPIGWQYVQ
jgi:hypothetical protein